MRYAIPVVGGKLSAHFGHCEQFALIDVDDETKVIKQKEFVVPPPHEPGAYPPWLAELGVSVIIAGGMGGRAQDLFTANRIKVIVGAHPDDPEKVVLDHMQGKLVVGDNTCDH